VRGETQQRHFWPHGQHTGATLKAMKKGQSLFKLQPFIFVRKQLFIQ
jgi:hypothetical protein